MDPTGEAVQHFAQSPNYVLEFTYLVASILFIFGLKGLSHPDTARRGMFLAEGGMAAAIIGTLFHHDIHFYGWIIAGLILGSLVGVAFTIWVPMTAMPQRTALSHAFGAIAASLVGIAEFIMHANAMPLFTRSALGLEVMLGSLTTTGSLIACGKLQGVIRGTPVQFKGQQYLNLLIFIGMAGCFIYSLYNPAASYYFYGMVCSGIPLRSHAGHPDWLGRHAGGDFAVEQLCRIVFCRHRLCAGQQHPDHCRYAGWLLRLHPVDPDVQGDEPLHHQRIVRRLRRGAARRGAGSNGGDARDYSLDDAAMRLAYATRSSSFPATDWPPPRRSTPCATWPRRWKSAASP